MCIMYIRTDRDVITCFVYVPQDEFDDRRSPIRLVLTA